MISGVSAYSSAYAPYAIASARRAGGAEQPFAVPSSALRTEESPAARPPESDSVTLSRDFPQLFSAATYAPPPIQQLQRSAEPVQETSAAAQSAASGSRATPGLGEEMDAQANGGGIPGDPGDLNAAPGEESAAETGAAGESEEAEETAETGAAENAEDAEDSEGANDPGEPDGANGQDLSDEQQAQVRELKNRDREVRAHEQAHQAVGGAYAGGASYEFQQGPDGQRYAVGGEVSIDVSAEREPEATIAKMQQVKAAAMAPAEPSGQDRAVAAAATATESEARSQLSEAGAAGETNEDGEDSAAEDRGETGAAGEARGRGEAGAAGELEAPQSTETTAAADATEADTPGEAEAADESEAGATGEADAAGEAEAPESAETTAAAGAAEANAPGTPDSAPPPAGTEAAARTAPPSRNNPYQNVSSASNVLNLPEAYRAIDIVA